MSLADEVESKNVSRQVNYVSHLHQVWPYIVLGTLFFCFTRCHTFKVAEPGHRTLDPRTESGSTDQLVYGAREALEQMVSSFYPALDLL